MASFHFLLMTFAVALLPLSWADHHHHHHHPGVSGRRGLPEFEDRPNSDVFAALESFGGTFSTLVSAVKLAGLDSALENEEAEFTVFAPTNDAFTKVDAESLRDLLSDAGSLSEVLLKHVVGDVTILAEDIPEGSTLLPTLAGEFVTVTSEDDEVVLTSSQAEAKVLQTDIKVKNGVIHVIDNIL